MRLELWESRLAALIETAKAAPFQWGRFDCCLFACDVINTLTGNDPAESFRGYENEFEAMKILKREGGVRAIAERGARDYGFTEINQLFAQRGDVCLAEMDLGETLGVCIGVEWAFPSRQDGLEKIPLDDNRIQKVWRIE